MYNDPVIKKYIDLITSITNSFKMIYQGEPTRIPVSSLPCLIISKRETRAGQITNAEDEHGIALNFIVVTDIRKELNDGLAESAEQKIMAGIAQLYDLTEGRNADYSLKTASLLGILRGNQIVDAAHNLRTDLSTLTRVDYGETLQNRAPEEWRVQARIEVVAQFIQTR